MQEPSPDDRTWGALASLLLSAALFLFYSIVQLVGVVAVVVAQSLRDPNAFDLGQVQLLLQQHFGLALWISVLFGLPFALAALWLLTRLRRPHGVARYLGLKGFRWWHGLLWLGGAFGLVVGIDELARIFERPPIPDFMEDVMTTAGFMPGLVLAIGVAAPLFEELLFRGFLFEGLEKSRLGGLGAVLVSSVPFAIIHIQYDPFDMFSVFLLGMLLGFARWHTGSTWLTIGLHAAINFFALFQANLYLQNNL